LLIASLGLIFIAAEFFTNGVEHLGERLNLGEAAVGSVLAAVGTAMPETLIPVVAILLAKGPASDAIGMGAILGAPFMLSTLAFTITSVAAFAYSRRRHGGARLSVNRAIVSRDLLYFLAMFSVAILSTWLPEGPPRWLVCCLLLGAYLHYVRANLKEGGASAGNLKPLRFRALWMRLSLTRLPEETREAFLHRRRVGADACPHTAATVGQVLVALGIMLIGARLFVLHVEHIAGLLQVSGLIISLVLAPIATELPEKLNSVIWVRESKETLALGNITGAMVFQSSVPATLGIALTDWRLHNPAVHGHAAFFAAFIALGSALLVLIASRHRRGDPANRTSLSPWVLLVGFPLYLLFVASIIFHW